MIPIQTWGGWGDILREISLLPCDWRPIGMGQLRPFRLGVYHLPSDHALTCPDANPPGPEAVKDFLRRCPGTSWHGVQALPRWQKALSRGIRMMIQPFYSGLFDPNLLWLPEDAIPAATKPRIVVQTHLSGLRSKRWDESNWRTVLGGIRTELPGFELHVLDPDGGAMAAKGVFVQDRLSFAQAVRLVSESHLLISIDSWSKYVAAWKDIPQVILVPDQSGDYETLHASTVWRYSFRGLHHLRKTRLFGLNPSSGKHAVYSEGTILEFSASKVLETICSLVSDLQADKHEFFR